MRHRVHGASASRIQENPREKIDERFGVVARQRALEAREILLQHELLTNCCSRRLKSAATLAVVSAPCDRWTSIDCVA
eukprot:528208-Prymnesium_polylepis.1